MPFQKEHPPMGGRPKGSPNRNNANAEALNRVLALCEEQIEKDLEKMKPAERVRLWEKLSEYKHAKVKRSPSKEPYWP